MRIAHRSPRVSYRFPLRVPVSQNVFIAFRSSISRIAKCNFPHFHALLEVVLHTLESVGVWQHKLHCAACEPTCVLTNFVVDPKDLCFFTDKTCSFSCYSSVCSGVLIKLRTHYSSFMTVELRPHDKSGTFTSTSLRAL